MQTLKRLAFVAIILAYAQIVFGAIVRITGSGMGCGDHWPKCAGEWFPPHDRMDLIIEISHRYLALALSLVILALFVTALLRRSTPGVSGKNGVLGPATLAAILVVTAALLGAVTVKMALNPIIIAAHLTIAMSLLATLAVALSRAGGLFASADLTGATPKTFRAARVAIVLAILTLVFGALTANLPDAAASCGGFPLCRTVNFYGMSLGVHITHRVLAFLLFGHLLGMAISARKRREPGAIRRAAWLTFAAALVQVLVAAAMIEMHFPPAFRSLHQAFGTLVWLAVVIMAILASRASHSAPADSALRQAA